MSGRSPSGVASLRARFEQNTESPSPSRGRSPAGSDFSDSSRPLSKVRTSFVSVDPSGKFGDSLGGKDMDGASNAIAGGEGAEEPKGSLNGPSKVNGNGGPTSAPKIVAEDPIKTKPDQEAPNSSMTMPENPDSRTTESTLAAANPDKPTSTAEGDQASILASDPKSEDAIPGAEALAHDTPNLGSILKGSAFEKDEAKKGAKSQKAQANGHDLLPRNKDGATQKHGQKAKEAAATAAKMQPKAKSEQPAPTKTQATSKPVAEQPASTKSQADLKAVAEQPASTKAQAAPKSVAEKPASTKTPAAPKAVTEQPATTKTEAAPKAVTEQLATTKTEAAPKPVPAAAPKPPSKEAPKTEALAKGPPAAISTSAPKTTAKPTSGPHTPTDSAAAAKKAPSISASPKAPAAVKETTKEVKRLPTKDKKPQARGSETAKPAAHKPISEHAKNDAGDAGHSREAHGNGPAAPKSTSAATNTSKPAHRNIALPQPSAFVKPKPKSPTRPVNLPSHLTAPTAASAAKHGDQPQTEHHKDSQPGPTRPPRPTPNLNPQQRKPPRVSMPTAGLKPAEREKPKPRMSVAGGASKAPEGSFLERMMRPTQSSAQKTHERVEPVKHSPPRKVLGSTSVSGSLIKPVSEHARDDAGDAGHRREAHGKAESHESGLAASTEKAAAGPLAPADPATQTL